nr:MAG TPA: hypothetical protein [Caudoviricetes sp.]
MSVYSISIPNQMIRCNFLNVRSYRWYYVVHLIFSMEKICNLS